MHQILCERALHVPRVRSYGAGRDLQPVPAHSSCPQRRINDDEQRRRGFYRLHCNSPPDSQAVSRFEIIRQMRELNHLPTDNGISHAVVVSDLHIGLPYFRKTAFIRLIQSLPADIALILNGDIIDNPYQRLRPEEESVLGVLREQSFQRRVIWLYGNHDEDFRMADPGRIEFQRGLAIGNRLLIIHGDDFDTIMPNNRWFIRLFKFCHNVRLRMGAAPVHVAELAKRWAPLLYRVLTEQVKRNAIDCAAQAGFAAVTCGHTHYAEDVTSRGVRYINTGTWTEEPVHYLSLHGADICLRSYQHDDRVVRLEQQGEDAEIDQASNALL